MPKRDSNHDLCDTSAVLYQLSYQAGWKLATLWVRNIPVDNEECKWIYERTYIHSSNIRSSHIHLQLCTQFVIFRNWAKSSYKRTLLETLLYFGQPRSQGLSSNRTLEPQRAVRWETLATRLYFGDDREVKQFTNMPSQNRKTDVSRLVLPRAKREIECRMHGRAKLTN